VKQQIMSEAKTKCTVCGAEILATTASRTGGSCMPCKVNPPSSEPPPTVEAIAAELEAAAVSLQTRGEVLTVPTRKIPLVEWEALPTRIRDQTPIWLRSLLSRYALHGLSLEYRDPIAEYLRIFSFLSPTEIKDIFCEGSLYEPLLATEFVPVGYEANGNLWLAKKSPTPDTTVYLFEHSGWEGGGAPTTKSGLRFAAARFSFLISSMGISEVSYYDLPTGSTRLIWKPDRSSSRRKSKY
jgi:hypothetical protein